MKQTNRKCPKCGYAVENESARYCKHCGTELPATAPASAPSDTGSVARRMLYKAGVCIVCMVVAAIALYKSCGGYRTTSDAGSSVEPEKVVLYSCEQCDETFTTKAGLQDHKDKDHPIFTCSQCGQRFSSREEFEEHEDIPHNFRCDQCGMAFTDAADLNAHKSSKHLDYKCKECGKEFKTKNELNAHIKSEHRTCKICGPYIWFKTKEELESHMKTFHEER